MDNATTVVARVPVNLAEADRVIEKARSVYWIRYGLDFDEAAGRRAGAASDRDALEFVVEVLVAFAVNTSDLLRGVAGAAEPEPRAAASKTS